MRQFHFHLQVPPPPKRKNRALMSSPLCNSALSIYQPALCMATYLTGSLCCFFLPSSEFCCTDRTVDSKGWSQVRSRSSFHYLHLMNTELHSFVYIISAWSSSLIKAADLNHWKLLLNILKCIQHIGDFHIYYKSHLYPQK